MKLQMNLIATLFTDEMIETLKAHATELETMFIKSLLKNHYAGDTSASASLEAFLRLMYA